MKYLKIQNTGELNKEFFHLMGVSTKSNDPTKIGEHGTGLKYALAYFVRNGIDLRIFLGEKELKIELKTKELKGHSEPIQVIYLNGKQTAIGINYGKQWIDWQAVREVYCNAMDEGITELNFEAEEVVGLKGHTTFYIDAQKVDEVIKKWGYYFTHTSPLYEDDKIAILPPFEDKKLRIYKQGILIHEDKHFHSMFAYDFKEAELNELREYKGIMQKDITTAIYNSNKEVAETFLKNYNRRLGEEEKPTYEHTVDWWWTTMIKDDIWKDFIYLHSSSDSMQDAYKVPKDLFTHFENMGFNVEQVSTEGRYYGYGGSGSVGDRDAIRFIQSPELSERIISFLDVKDIPFKIGAKANKDKFDFVIGKNKQLIFSIHLKDAHEQELLAVIYIAEQTLKGKEMYTLLKEAVMNTL
jgi:hypothetical protein